jgi:hypothetical protein
MIRSILIVVIVIVTFVLTGANYKSADANPGAKEKKFCRGYTVIEVDKGVDCNGDTIRLVKTNGYFERAM